MKKKHYTRKSIAVLLALVFTLIFTGISAVAANSAYENTLIQEGFPESYAKKLAAVHSKHPNWTFTPLLTGLDWDASLATEATGHRNCVYIQPNGASATRLYRDQSTGTYTPKNGFDYSYAVRDGSTSQSRGWIDASKMAISYYMNPLTFIGNDVTILQFESLNWNFADTTTGNQDAYNATIAILENTFMYTKSNGWNANYVDSNGNIKYVDTNGVTQTTTVTYPQAICGAAKTYNLDPCYLAAKIIGEVGSRGSGSVSGQYSGYVGYYNYLNIGATDSSSGEAVANGLAYAKTQGWTNPVASIYGGAEKIANDYVSKGQNTAYLQKFNVSGNRNFSHQYMTAVNGVVTTTYMSYEGYQHAGILDTSRRFIIPVYTNMPSANGSTVRFTGYSNDSGTLNANAPLKSSASYAGGNATTLSAGTNVTVLGGYRDTRVTYDPNYRINATYYRMFAPLWYRVRTASGATGYVQEDYLNVGNRAALNGNQTIHLKYSVSGSEKPSFMSQDTRIATVDANGNVTARGVGTTKIVVYLTNGSFDVLNLTVTGTGFQPAPAAQTPVSSNPSRPSTNTNTNTQTQTPGRRPSRNTQDSSQSSQDTGRVSNGTGLLRAIRSLFGR